VLIKLKIFVELIKLRLALAVVLSAAVGYILRSGTTDTLLVLISVGVLLLASGSAALNHWQEHLLDGKMPRTARRPIPAAAISRKSVAVMALCLSLSGLVLLYFTAGWLPALLGLLTLLWYNAVYTPLKPHTSYALMIGALVGAIPPAIGYTAAGGSITDPVLWILCLFFFVWQVPHFLLLLLRYGDEYLIAGFRSLNRFLSVRQMANLTLVWIIALVVSSALLPLFGMIRRDLFIIVLLVAGGALVAFSFPLLNPTAHDSHIPKMFRVINGFMILVAHLIMIDNMM
jgi:heme o synthase